MGQKAFQTEKTDKFLPFNRLYFEKGLRLRTSFFTLLFILGTSVTFGQVRVLTDTDLTDSTQYIDLSKKLIWGTNSIPTSCFSSVEKTDLEGTSRTALTLSDSGRKYFNWHLEGHLKNCNSLDFPFPRVDRSVDSLRIELDVLWDTLTNGGEDGRINVILLHQYPAGGPRFGMTDSVETLPHPFGRPTYSFRVVPRILAIGGYRGFMTYGGNNDSLGKLYTQNDPTGNPRWWMPGAVSVSGPYFNVAGMFYPKSPYFPFNGDQIVARKIWKTITWELGKEHLRVFHRKTREDSSQNQLAYSMFIPAEGNVLDRLSGRYNLNLDSLPYLYRWFRYAEALRIYGVGVIRTFWGGVRIKAFGPGSSTAITPKRTDPVLKLLCYPGYLRLTSGQEILEAELFDYPGRRLGAFRAADEDFIADIPAVPALVRVKHRDGRIEVLKVTLVP